MSSNGAAKKSIDDSNVHSRTFSVWVGDVLTRVDMRKNEEIDPSSGISSFLEIFILNGIVHDLDFGYDLIFADTDILDGLGLDAIVALLLPLFIPSVCLG